MNYAGKSNVDAERAVDILVQFISGFHSSYCADQKIGENSITHFEEPRAVPVCGQSGRLPKSSIIFNSMREIYTAWKISANS